VSRDTSHPSVDETLWSTGATVPYGCEASSRGEDRGDAIYGRSEGSPGEDGNPRGDRALGSLNRGPDATDSPGEQGLESEPREGRPQGSPARGNGKRARSRRRVVTAPGEGKTLKGKAWTCQWDETSPQGISGSKPPRGCENLRADGGGGVETIATANPEC